MAVNKSEVQRGEAPFQRTSWTLTSKVFIWGAFKIPQTDTQVIWLYNNQLVLTTFWELQKPLLLCPFETVSL